MSSQVDVHQVENPYIVLQVANKIDISNPSVWHQVYCTSGFLPTCNNVCCSFVIPGQG